MPAPNAENAWDRAVGLILIPSVGLVILLVLAKDLWGGVVAGVILNLASLLLLAVIAGKATYWNTVYTGVIAIGGTILMVIAPSVLSVFVHPALAALNEIIYILFVGYIWLLFIGKLDIDLPQGPSGGR